MCPHVRSGVNKDIEKGLEDSKEYSTEEEDEVFPEIELFKKSDEKEEGKNNEAVKNNSDTNNALICVHCSFNCREDNIFQKHMNNEQAINFKAHQCKTCREKFNSLSHVLEHDVKKHQDEQVQNNTSFVFRESMLDEFDI